MKATLRIAAAGACLSALSLNPAHAMSDRVQFYGIFDIGVSYVDNGPSDTEQFALTHGALSGSRWGVRGTEKLSDDLSVHVVLEGGLNSADGRTLQGSGASARLFGRQANVSLDSKQWGRLSLGRHNTLMITWMNKFNPFQNANFSSGKRADPALSDRMDNGVMYTRAFGDVSFGAYYSTGWNNDTDWDDEKKGRLYGTGLRYASGALEAAVLWHTRHAPAPVAGASSDNVEDRIVAGIAYTIDAMKLFAGYRWLDQDLTQRALRSDLYWVGATYSLQKHHRLKVVAYQLDGTVCTNLNALTCPANQASEDQKPALYVIGNEYDLSGRTTLYSNMAYAKNDNGSSLSILGGGYGANVQPDENQFGVVLGIRHRF